MTTAPCPHCRASGRVEHAGTGTLTTCDYCHGTQRVSQGDADVYVRVLEQHRALHQIEGVA